VVSQLETKSKISTHTHTFTCVIFMVAIGRVPPNWNTKSPPIYWPGSDQIRMSIALNYHTLRRPPAIP